MQQEEDEVAVVKVADALAHEETVVVTAEDAASASEAVMRSRRCVLLAIVAVTPAGLDNHGKGDTLARRVRSNGQG